jgi:aromatic amino acid aminotransferase I
MFLWLRIKAETHPALDSTAPEEISERVFHALVDEGVLTVPSTFFKAPGGPERSNEEKVGKMFVRLSFSLPGEKEMEEGVKRMARALKREWAL